MCMCLSVSVLQNESEAQPEETPPHSSPHQISMELNEVCDAEITKGMYSYIVAILDIYTSLYIYK